MRYFSLPTNNATEKAKGAIFKETTQFLERKESLINRLFKAKSSTGADDDVVILNEPEPLHSVNKPVAVERKQEKPPSEIVFFDDYIPIETNATKEKVNCVYDPDIEPTGYTGPYSPNCILKVRKCLIAELNNNRTGNTTNRRLEIAKIKVNIPSKFDNDKKLKRKLGSIESQRKNDFDDRYQRLLKQNTKSPKSTKFFDDDDDNNNDNDNKDFDVDVIDLTSTDNEVEYLTDSKCTEFEKYTNNKSKNKSKTSNKRKISEKCEELQANYRQLRLERKILLRRKNKNPSVELEEKEKHVFGDMKKIRKSLKKLRKKPGRKFNRSKNSTFKSKKVK